MSSIGRVIPPDGLRVRTGPGTEHDTLGALKMGEEVVLIGLVGAWWGAETRFGPGFVHSAFIQVVEAREDNGGGGPAELSYTCVKDDTLSSIGRRFGVAFTEIATLNGLVEPFVLQIGQVLRIPAGGVRPLPRPEPVVTGEISLLNPFLFAVDTEVTSSSLQGHHTPFLGACSCDLDVRGFSSPGTTVQFNAAGPEGTELRGIVREIGLACKSQRVQDGGRTVKLAIQQRRDGGAWEDTGAWILYAHLDPVTVNLGDVVSSGGSVGAMGPSTGPEYNSSCAQGSHVHMEATRARCVVNQGAVIRGAAVMTLDV